MSKTIAESSFDVFFRSSPIKVEEGTSFSMAELKKSLPHVFYDCDVYAYVMLQHPHGINTAFISHLEIRVLVSLSTPTSTGATTQASITPSTGPGSGLGPEKMPWYSNNEFSVYWNGANSDLSSTLLQMTPTAALIAIKIHMPSTQASKNRTFANFTFSLMWKPSEKISVDELDGRSTNTTQSLAVLDPNYFLVDSINHAVLTSCAYARKEVPFSPAVFIPVRRTSKKQLEIRPAFSLTVNSTPVVDDALHLLVDVENTSNVPLIVDSIKLEVAGVDVKLVPGLVQTGLTLRPGDVYGYLYSMILFDKTTLDNSSTEPNFSNAVPQQILFADKIKQTRIRVEGHLLSDQSEGSTVSAETSAVIKSIWKLTCDLQNGQIMALPSSEKEAKGKIVVQEIDVGGVSLAFRVLSDVSLHKIFTVQLSITNHSKTVKNLEILLPSASSSSSSSSNAAFNSPLSPKTTNANTTNITDHRQRVYMSPLEFLEMYDSWQTESKSIVCLENNIMVTDLQPGASSAMHLHFVAIKGSGTLQNIEFLKCIDLDNHQEFELFNVLQGILIK